MQVGWQIEFDAIGTSWSIEVYEPVTAASQKRLEAAIYERISSFDQQYSRFRPDSLIALMAKQAGQYTLPDDARPLFDIYEQLYHLTQGTVTPLIGQTLVQAGYDKEYSLHPGHLTAPPRWEEAMEYNFPLLTLHQPVQLDLGAAGKGYLVDLLCQIIASYGLSVFCVDGGGDMFYQNPTRQPLTVGLEDPTDTSRIIGTVELLNQSLCGSAGNRRAWGEFHHIINPHTQTSPRHLAAVWVTASSALLADALTTALFFAPAAHLTEHFDFDYAIMDAHGMIEWSKDFPATIFAA